MRTLAKVLLITTTISLLIIAGGGLLLKHSPLTVLSFISPYTITAKNLTITLSTPSITAQGLQANTSEGNIAATVEEFSLHTTWQALLFSNNKAWVSSIKKGAVYMENIAQKNKEKKLNTSAKRHPILHRILRKAELSINDIAIHLANHNTVTIKQVYRPESLPEQQQGLAFAVSYQQGEITIPIEGQLVSLINNDAPEIILSIPTLDLRELMSTQNKKKQVTTTSANQQTSQALSEAVIDWSPLLQWSPITLNIQSKKIRLAQGEINNLSSRMILKRKDQSHHIQQQHTSTLAITLPNGMSFNHPIVLSTDWQTLGPTTQGADIKGSTQLTFGDSQFTLDGKLNLNHRMQEEILLTMHLEQFPFKANSNSAKKLKQQSALLLPFSASTQLHFKDQQLQLSSLMVKAKKSDITGDITLDVNTQANKRKTLRFDLTSQKLVIPHGSTPKTNKKKTGSLFTNDKIATNWLNTMNIDGNIRIKTVWYKNHAVLAGVDNHIRLNKKTFTLKNTTKNIGKGTANFTVSLSHKNNTLRLKTSGSAKKILLEALQLVPKEELSGGKTNASFSLSSYGNSTKSLASHLQGKLLLTATDGVITNNSFEAIGSDLLLKIVNTINPFYKESKTTDLECAVIKAKITDGKMLFDDSIAIKTSKMIIIGDGNINLATEKINVGINPKARAGVGIDVASLAKFIAIQGDLSAPSIGVSGTGTAKSLLSIGAAISTGGLSLLATKIADAVISGDACKVAENAFNA